MTSHSGSQQPLFPPECADQTQSPVECLGLIFPNDEARRQYFIEKLREKLRDAELRKIEGFPTGSDEDILAISDPPYYTACPNPFLEDFIEHFGKPFDPEHDDYRREPFASDTGAGKTHPVYTAHPYHSKIPHLAIMPSILHFTQPGDLVLDGFSGSGMTGVAAQLCGQPERKFETELEQEWKETGHPAPQWGTRNALLVDLSPIANFIAYNLNAPVNARAFASAAKAFLARLDGELGWMYETRHTDGKTKGRINYVVWSEVYRCQNCAGDILFIEQGLDRDSGRFGDGFQCPHCRAKIIGKAIEHKFTTVFDEAAGETVRIPTYVPVEIEYTVKGRKGKLTKRPDPEDLALIERLSKTVPADWFPTDRLPIGKMRDSGHLAQRGIRRYHRFYLPRALHALSKMWEIIDQGPDVRVRNFLKFMVEPSFWGMTFMNGYEPLAFSRVNRFMKGAYYVRPVIAETSPWYTLEGKLTRLLKLLESRQLPSSRSFLISTASMLGTAVPENSVDYIYTDPPFGDAVKYGDLNLLIEAWHRLFSHLDEEILWDELKGKNLHLYGEMMRDAFAGYYRVLKPGRWITVVFHNSKNIVWNAIQEAIGGAGFVVADVRTLDRVQGSFNQVTAAGAVKQDLVISAYKPVAVLEERFRLESGSEEGAWDFVRGHLRQLTVFEPSGDGRAKVSAERMDYLLFDRMVAFHIQRGVAVPLSAGQFYAGLRQRFPERDAMFFLPDQVDEYDRKRSLNDAGPDRREVVCLL